MNHTALIKRYGFKTQSVGAMVNGYWMKRPDVISVRYQGHHIMTMPKKMYPFPVEEYRTLEGLQQPTFYEMEYKLKNWNLVIRRSPYLKEREKKELQAIKMTQLYD